MRIFSRPRMTATVGMALTLGALAVLTAKPAAAAAPSGQVVVTESYTSALRLGGYFPFESPIRQNVGTVAFSGGLDYAVNNTPGISRTVISVDAIYKSSGNHHLQMIPVTFGDFFYNGGDKNGRPYTGFGIGTYFVQESLVDELGNDYSKNGMAFGGFIAAGMDFQDHYFVDARYHYVAHIGPVSAQGLELTAGVRF